MFYINECNVIKLLLYKYNNTTTNLSCFIKIQRVYLLLVIMQIKYKFLSNHLYYMYTAIR